MRKFFATLAGAAFLALASTTAALADDGSWNWGFQGDSTQNAWSGGFGGDNPSGFAHTEGGIQFDGSNFTGNALAASGYHTEGSGQEFTAGSAQQVWGQFGSWSDSNSGQ